MKKKSCMHCESRVFIWIIGEMLDKMAGELLSGWTDTLMMMNYLLWTCAHDKRWDNVSFKKISS